MKPISFTGIRLQALRQRSVGKVLLLTVLACCFSCAEFLDIDQPKNQIVGETAYKSDATATAAIIGIYAEMINAPSFASISVTLWPGFSADELTIQGGNDFLANNLKPSNTTIKTSLWEPGYKYIYYANALLDGISKSTNVSQGVRESLEGEAKFIRAFTFFYLTNLFGDVPLITGMDYKVNASFGRTPQAQVYEQIISDLKDAVALLPEDYSAYDDKRIRPNKWAAMAMLARVYLYLGAWAAAEEASTAVINAGLYALQDLDSVFIANNREALWQLGFETETFEKTIFDFTNPASSILLHNEMVNAFEAGDERKLHWTGCSKDGQHRFPSKYKDTADKNALPEHKEYSTVLRLAEQHLIRAEARAWQNKLSDAIADVDMIRARAKLPVIKGTNPLIDREGLLLAIEQERRIEFMAEWGHRWLDLKRTRRADRFLTSVKADWQSTDVLYPIPQSEIDNNPNLNPQNDGY
jgi:starch-binding outer membrane protein, SusD/RagB family